MFTVSLPGGAAELTQAILTDTADYINSVLRSSADTVKSQILDKIEESIWAAPEVQSLLNGELGQELGVVNAKPIVSDIIEQVKGAMNFTIDPAIAFSGRLVGGGYIVEVLRKDFTEVLSTPDAAYVTKNNVFIPWLNWLLFAGSSPLIYGYRIVLNPNNPTNSRTGGAIMVKTAGGSWAVPQDYAGTQENNFLTRALANLGTDIDKIITEELAKRI